MLRFAGMIPVDDLQAKRSIKLGCEQVDS